MRSVECLVGGLNQVYLSKIKGILYRIPFTLPIDTSEETPRQNRSSRSHSTHRWC
ncbi:MAG: hypothetical protein RLZZ308_582 [Candidatus Parcubacteria bacterium]|jgi:hypothetical protein